MEDPVAKAMIDQFIEPSKCDYYTAEPCFCVSNTDLLR